MSRALRDLRLELGNDRASVTGINQANHYTRDYDYWSESPHLKHRHLYELLMVRVARVISSSSKGESPPEILEIGAGDGAVTERLLSLGCSVTGTEMSEASVDAISSRFGINNRFEAVHDAAGDLRVLDGKKFDVIVFASVLHHIPDYLAAISRALEHHLRPGGAIISIQDPLWYPRMPPVSLRITKGAYLLWRLTRGNIARGLRTRLRRRTKGLSDDVPGDTVEYHVVRDGVDEDAIFKLLDPVFDDASILSYWSSQGALQQRVGEMLKLENSFAIFASGYRPKPAESADRS